MMIREPCPLMYGAVYPLEMFDLPITLVAITCRTNLLTTDSANVWTIIQGHAYK